MSAHSKISCYGYMYIEVMYLLNLFELTFDFQVCLAGEVIALSDDTSVPATVTDLGVLDGKGKEIFVSLDCKLSASVALLKKPTGQF